MPEISLVIPVYNGEKFLPAAIGSVLDQEYADFELIIVNDCSTDSTPRIIADFAKRDDRVKVINNPVNQKLPKSLNIGFQNATGKYFTWTSDDNFLLPDCLAKLHTAIIQSGADIVYANSVEVDENDNFLLVHERDSPVENLCFENTIGACFLYKSEVHKKNNGFRTDLFLLEDYDFWVRAWLNGFKYSHLNAAPYVYRRHQKSLSNQFLQQVAFKKLNYHLKMRGAFKKDKTLERLVDNEISRLRKRFYFDDSRPVSADIAPQNGREPFNLHGYVETAARLLENGDATGAKKLLDNILWLLPTWVEGLVLYSYYYEMSGDLPNAIKTQETAARLDSRPELAQRLEKLRMRLHS